MKKPLSIQPADAEALDPLLIALHSHLMSDIHSKIIPVATRAFHEYAKNHPAEAPEVIRILGGIADLNYQLQLNIAPVMELAPIVSEYCESGYFAG